MAEETTEEKGAPWGSMDPKNQKPVPNPEIMDPTNYPKLSESIDNLTDVVSKLLEKMSSVEEVDDLKLAIKARDDQIEALHKKVEINTKSEDVEEETKTEEKSEEEVNPQTVTVTKDDTPKVYSNSPIKIRHGEVYFDDDM